MAPEMPTLGEQPKKSPLPGVLVTAVLAGAIGGGVYWFNNRGTETPPAPVEAAPVVAAVPVEGQPPAVAPEVPGTPVAPVAAPPAVVVKPSPAEPKDGLRGFTATINGPLEGAIVGAVGKEIGAPLTQVVNRSLVWWVRVPADLLKGDEIQVVFEERANAEPLVHAVRFTSKKFGKTFETYRFKADNEAFPRFYDPSGDELEQRLVDGPLDSWEQVTSLLRDGRKHKGVDFKTPVGTPVKATFDGTILRTTWNFRSNGNSIEIAESGGQGRSAMFLHLQEVPKTIQAGQKVKKGTEIAKSGNTGHSFAPHLHYQLMKGGQAIDPFESHKTYRVSLPAAQKPKLDAEVTRLKNLFTQAGGGAGGGVGAR